MARLFADLVTEVLFDEFDRTKYQALVGTWLGEAAQKVSRAVKLPSSDNTTTISVVAGTQNYPLAESVEKLYWVSNSDGTYLIESDIDEVTSSSERGKPAYFAIWDDELYFWPIPSAADTLTVRYRGGLPDVTDDSTLAAFPDDYYDLLVNYARSKAFAAEDDLEMANYYRGLFESELNRARAALQERSENRPRQIQGMMPDPGSHLPRFRRP